MKYGNAMLEPQVRISGLSFELSSTVATGSQRTIPGRSAHDIIMSCQASPVAERKRTSTAWKNDWKLLFRVMAVLESITIFPNICKKKYMDSKTFLVQNQPNKNRPACQLQRRWKTALRSTVPHKAELEMIWWRSKEAFEYLHLYLAVWRDASHETAERSLLI